LDFPQLMHTCATLFSWINLPGRRSAQERVTPSIFEKIEQVMSPRKRRRNQQVAPSPVPIESKFRRRFFDQSANFTPSLARQANMGFLCPQYHNYHGQQYQKNLRTRTSLLSTHGLIVDGTTER